VKDGGAVEYSSSSFRLGDQVAELARSLGAYVIREERQTSFTYKGEKKKGRPSLRIRIYFNDDTIPCSSEKHLAKWRGRGGRRQFRTMVSIEPSRVAEAVCIAVAHPTRQFVTKDFIVTHNTYKALGLMKSFLVLENPTLFIDAERSTPKGFARIALDEMLKSPIFFYHRPTTYEATVSEVRRFCNIVKGLREKKKLHPDSVGLVVVDSIRKLVPAQQWEKILKLQAADAKADNVRDRAAQIKALMNAAWCDELIPLLEQTGCTMVIIARETDDAEAASKMTARQKMFSRSMPYKTGGGSALYYDASLDVRVELEGYVMKERAEGEQGPGVVYGERHRVTIKKSKVSGKVDKVITCFFHTSNGKLVPEGFDRARDVLEVGKNLGVVKINSKAAKPPPSSWLMWRGMRWHGDHLAVKKLTDSPELLADLEREVRAKFRSEAA
jgi:RecA/RadA recombinase